MLDVSTKPARGVEGADLFHALREELIIKEARRRHRRRLLSIAVVLTAISSLALALGFGLQLSPSTYANSHLSPLPQPPTFVGHSGTTLVYGYESLRIIDSDTGTSRGLPLPAPIGGSSDLSMVDIGKSFVLNRGNEAWLYRPDFRGSPINLGASLRVIPGPTDDEVWIWSDPCATATGCTTDSSGTEQGNVRLVNSSGLQIGQPIPLPAPADGWYPTGQAVTAGLVLDNVYGTTGEEEIWNPISSTVVRVLPHAQVIAAGGNVAAWNTGRACLPHCTLHLTNVQTGAIRNIPLPRGFTITGDGAMSPNGTILAIPVGIGGAWPYVHPTEVLLVYLRTGGARVLSGTEQHVMPNYGPVAVTWSSNGWLFATAIGDRHVLIWRPGDAGAMVLSRVRLPGLDLGIPPEMQQELPTLIAI